MNFLTKALGTFAVALAFTAHVNAAPVLNFEIGDGSSVALSNVTGWSLPELEVQLDDNLAGLAFSLAEGESYTFDFFHINLPAVGTGSADLTATLEFDTPTLTSTGSAAAEWWSVFFISGGDLTWDSQPGDITLADGSVFNLSFSDLTGIQWGNGWVAVEATVTANSVAVPEPGSLALLGLGMIGLGIARRRRD